MNDTALGLRSSAPLPALVMRAGERAGIRFLEFFASTIRNPHTRRAYARAVGEFLAWCAGTGVPSITAVQPLHVAGWIELQTQSLSAPTAKQRLDAIRHLFDWLVTGQVVPHNPAASVRGPNHSAKTGKTPVLEAAEARQLLDAIDVTTPVGLRDRALIALMVFRLRASERHWRCASTMSTCSSGACGCVCAKRVARRTRCRVTTRLGPICTPTATARGSRPIRRGRCSGRLRVVRGS
jgi:Phage integrase, N-terminal SAM-like domain